MTVNKVQYIAQKRLPNDLRKIKQQLRALKQPQPLGSDVIAVKGTGVFRLTDTIPAGGFNTYSVTYTPEIPTLVLPDLAFSIFVDNDLNANFELDYGSSLTGMSADQQKISYQLRHSWGQSIDTLNVANGGQRVYLLKVSNNGASVRNLFYYFEFYTPTYSGATG